jgi:hypothetical protein
MNCARSSFLASMGPAERIGRRRTKRPAWPRVDAGQTGGLTCILFAPPDQGAPVRIGRYWIRTSDFYRVSAAFLVAQPKVDDGALQNPSKKRD